MLKMFFLSILALVGTLAVAHSVPAAQADGFSLSSSFEITDSVTRSVNVSGVDDTADPGAAVGFFVGTLAEYKKDGNKLLGFGGVLAQASPGQVGEDGAEKSIGYSASVVPLTLFNDLIQIGYGYNFADRSRLVSFGLSISKAGKAINPF